MKRYKKKIQLILYVLCIITFGCMSVYSSFEINKEQEYVRTCYNRVLEITKDLYEENDGEVQPEERTIKQVKIELELFQKENKDNLIIIKQKLLEKEKQFSSNSKERIEIERLIQKIDDIQELTEEYTTKYISSKNNKSVQKTDSDIDSAYSPDVKPVNNGSDVDGFLSPDVEAANNNTDDWESFLRDIEADPSISSKDKTALKQCIMEYNRARRDYERSEELIKDNAISQQDYYDAFSAYNQAYDNVMETIYNSGAFRGENNIASEGSDLKKAVSPDVIPINERNRTSGAFREDNNIASEGSDLKKAVSPDVIPVNERNRTVTKENSNSNNVNNRYVNIEQDLAFLQECSNDELMPLVAIMKDRISDELSYQAKTNPRGNLEEVIYELELYGGNTFANLWRGKGVPYREVLEDVCKKQGIQFDRNLSTEDLGALLVEQTVANFINQMSHDQKKEFVNELKEGMKENEFNYLLKQVGGINGLMSSSGKTFASLLFDKVSGEKISATSIIFGISDNFGVAVPTSVQLLTSGVADYFGTFGYLVIAAIAMTEIGGPAYRVTVPAATYIECLRIIKLQEEEEIVTDNNFLFIFGIVLILLLCVLIFFYIKKNKNNILKEENKNITNNFKLICPKCNTENNTINSFCTKCHYVFTKEVKNNKEKKENNEKLNGKNIETSKAEVKIETIETNKETEEENMNKETNEDSKEEDIKQEEIKEEKTKIICPKCKTQNSKMNYFCTKCHYVFSKEDKNK